MNNATHFTPVVGETVHDSFFTKALFCCIAFFFALVPGSAIVWCWWHGLTIFDGKITWWLALCGGVMALVGLVGVLALIHSMFQRRRIVIGSDYFQILNNDTVESQIPYRNIARLEHTEHKSLGKCIFIDVIDLNEPATLCPTAERNKRSFGWHFVIFREAWKQPMAIIYELLNYRLRKIERLR
jgi:hypothetical protein